jgi:uncharacterized protein with von Willebrand factor type A (vWA) domain
VIEPFVRFARALRDEGFEVGTGAIADGDAGRALERAAAEVVDWEGGTRIGATLTRSCCASRWLAYRVVWLNPLAAEEGYEPIAAGCRRRCRTSIRSAR